MKIPFAFLYPLQGQARAGKGSACNGGRCAAEALAKAEAYGEGGVTLMLTLKSLIANVVATFTRHIISYHGSHSMACI
jgi:hypothetical protein